MAKNPKNVVEEWTKSVKKDLLDARKESYSVDKEMYIMKAIGKCDAILIALGCCDNE